MGAMADDYIDPNLGEYGPAMRALPNDMWRRFVIEMCTPVPDQDGQINYTECAVRAGFSPGNRSAAKRAASRLAHDERIQAAFLEESDRRLGAALPVATAALMRIMTTSTKEANVLKAVAMIYNRKGLHEKTEHTVTTRREFSKQEKLERALTLAVKLGLDPAKMLGAAGYNLDGTPIAALPAPVEEPVDLSFLDEPEPIDVEFTDATDDDA